MNSNLKQYEVWLADLNPRFGTEPGKKRPVAIVQTNALNAAGHPSTLVCPISTNVIKGASILRIHLSVKEGGTSKPSDVLVDQVRAIDNRRFIKPMGILSSASKKALQGNLKIIFDL
jgi:mRNA interferase MazF